MTATTQSAGVRAQASTDLTPRRAAQVAGVGYVLLFGLAIFANFFVRDGLIVADDAAATATNIAASNGLFRLGLLAFLAVFLIDVVVAWALYIVFRADHGDLSLFAAWSRLVYTVLLGVAAVFFFEALAIYESPTLDQVMTVAERNAEALVVLESFNAAWLVGLAAFGVHLIVLGCLVARSDMAPRRLGVFMVVAGIAYLIDTTAYTLLSNYDDYAAALLVVVAVPSVVAEGWFGLWLLLRGGSSHRSRVEREGLRRSRGPNDD